MLLRGHWEWILTLGHPFVVAVGINVAVHIVVLFANNIPLMLVYKHRPASLEQYRSEPDLPFPWEEKDPSRWRSL